MGPQRSLVTVDLKLLSILISPDHGPGCAWRLTRASLSWVENKYLILASHCPSHFLSFSSTFLVHHPQRAPSLQLWPCLKSSGHSCTWFFFFFYKWQFSSNLRIYIGMVYQWGHNPGVLLEDQLPLEPSSVGMEWMQSLRGILRVPYDSSVYIAS